MILFIIFSFIMPIVYIVLGLIFWNHAPKKINTIAGWRTKQAMCNQETWNFANAYGGRSVFILGMILAIISIVLCLVFNGFDYDGIDWSVILIMVVQVGLMGVVFRRVENTIRKKFDGNGRHR